jgi:murein hydrolase activator
MRRLLLILFVFASAAAHAQQKEVQMQYSKSQLEEKRKEILDAIGQTEKELESIKHDKNASMVQLRALQSKLAERQRLISNINESINDIDNTIVESSHEVGTLKKDLEQYKIRYAQSIRYAYESRSSYDMMAFLFSSRDFNEAIRRMKYLKKFRRFRMQQVEQIRITQSKLQNKIGVLNAQKAQKDELLASQLQQKQVLVKETSETDNVIKQLKGKEGELMKEIEKKRIVANRINDAINKVIEREMEAARKKAEEEEKKRLAAGTKPAAANPTKTTATKTPERPNETGGNKLPPAPKPRPENETPLYMTPTDMALSSSFEGNRGKLYWPVEKGFITDHFGTHAHPLAEKVMIDNPGIDIRTSEGAPIRSVFEGTVSSVFSTVGSNQVVIIQHGNYFTVYNGLQSVSVKKDQHVNTNEAIGVVANNDEGEPTVNFQIWKAAAAGKKGQTKLNPEQWIGRLR